jgi:hypothetical protein
MHGALHVGYFFGAFVDEQDDQQHLGMVGGDTIGDGLQEHRLACTRRRHDEAALPLADRREEVDDAHGDVAIGGFQPQALIRVDGGQIIEEDASPDHLRVFEVNGLDAQERKIFLIPLWRPYLAGNRIALAHVEAADL